MKDKVILLIGDKLDALNLFVDSVIYEKEGRNNYLRICLDSNKDLDVSIIVQATKIIDPLIEEANLINEAYILDIYGKSKGDVNEKA